MRPKGKEAVEADRYYTVLSAAEGEIKVKGSRFLSFISPVKNIEEAETRIRFITRKYHDASHVCFAYRIEGGIFRTSDAGEPPGTAGRPILDVIDGHGLCYVLCVVVRYFGGTKLGTGGLARAYAEAAKEAVGRVKKTEKWITVSMKTVFDHKWTGLVRSLLAKYGCFIENTDIGDVATIVFSVRSSLAGSLKQDMADSTSGHVVPQNLF